MTAGHLVYVFLGASNKLFPDGHTCGIVVRRRRKRKGYPDRHSEAVRIFPIAIELDFSSAVSSTTSLFMTSSSKSINVGGGTKGCDFGGGGCAKAVPANNSKDKFFNFIEA